MNAFGGFGHNDILMVSGKQPQSVKQNVIVSGEKRISLHYNSTKLQ